MAQSNHMNQNSKFHFWDFWLPCDLGNPYQTIRQKTYLDSYQGIHSGNSDTNSYQGIHLRNSDLDSYQGIRLRNSDLDSYQGIASAMPSKGKF
jgi:hypothetical protein